MLSCVSGGKTLAYVRSAAHTTLQEIDSSGSPWKVEKPLGAVEFPRTRASARENGPSIVDVNDLSYFRAAAVGRWKAEP